LSELGTLRGISGAALAFAGTFLGFGINVFKDLQINSGAAADVVVRWQTIGAASLLASVFFAIVAFVYWRKGHSKLEAIKSAVDFSCSQIEQPKRF